MQRLLVFSVAVAVAFAGPLSSDGKKIGNADGCVDWDDKISQLLLEPMQEQIKKSESEFVKVGDGNEGFFGFGAEWKKAKAGDFSTLGLNIPAGEQSASKLCTNGNVKTLTVNLGFGDLQAAFDTLTLYTPFFSIGGGKTTLSLKGENLLVEVSTTTDPTTKKCSAQLGTLLFNQWGSLELDLGDGLINMIISKLFNVFASTRIIGVLETFNVDQEINDYAVEFMKPVLAKYGDMICTAIG